jgi:hypothetical protein
MECWHNASAVDLGMFPQPLKAPKSGPKDYDENDLEYLKKKKEEVGGQHQLPSPLDC